MKIRTPEAALTAHLLGRFTLFDLEAEQAFVSGIVFAAGLGISFRQREMNFKIVRLKLQLLLQKVDAALQIPSFDEGAAKNELSGGESRFFGVGFFGVCESSGEIVSHEGIPRDHKLSGSVGWIDFEFALELGGGLVVVGGVQQRAVKIVCVGGGWIVLKQSLKGALRGRFIAAHKNEGGVAGGRDHIALFVC